MTTVALTRCAYSGITLCTKYGSYHMVRRHLIPLIAECTPLDVALVFRFIKFYRTVLFCQTTWLLII